MGFNSGFKGLNWDIFFFFLRLTLEILPSLPKRQNLKIEIYASAVSCNYRTCIGFSSSVSHGPTTISVS